MKTLREQIANRCRHFTGIQNKACEAGVEYATVRDETARPYRWPCFVDTNAATSCAARSLLSVEEVDAEVAESDRSFKAMCEARAAIVATKQDAGTVACPRCGTADALRFRVASCNGHVHAACATAGCLAWME